MAQIALPRHQATQSQSPGVGSPLYQRRQQSNAAMVEMVPNPDFSFPMRAPDAPSTDASPTKPRPMSLQAYPAARRGSMPHARQKSVNALPAFSFNPAGNAPPPTETSPQTSPLLSPTTPAKPMHGHRRGGSELIGGSARTGATLLSSSPTKDGSLSPPTATLLPGPPAGRRGHAHRRSAAISSHDLSSIMNPPPPSRTGSAPNTPAEGINEFKFGHSVNKSMSQPCLRNSNSDDESTPRPPSRARVGFSDKVEYIRPLSTISSETEASTLRGHSTTNSLSSIVGGSTVSPPFTRSGTPTLSTVEDENESRPGTAGAVLDKILSNPLIEDVSDRKRPMSAVSSSRSHSAGPSPTSLQIPSKRRGFFRFESKNSESSGHRRLPTSISDPALTTTFNSSPLASPLDLGPLEDGKSKSRKSSHKPRKVKSWANSIIPRKGKHGKKSKRRASTPEPDAVVADEDTDSSDDLDFSPNFDDDTSVTIVSPTADTVPGPKINTDYASWQPRQLKRVDSDIMSPIIDMDASLGPFNTPNGINSKPQQRGFSAHRRAMHSASGIVSNHRRTESAPELVPFEFRPSAATSTSPMADVFEEEEPEEETAEVKKDPEPATIPEKPEQSDEPAIQIVETDSRQSGPIINWNFNDGLGLRRAEPRHSPILEEPLSPHAVPQSAPSASCSQVEVVEDYEEPRTSSLTHSSDSTVTPQSTLEEFKEHQSTMAVPIPLAQQSLMTPNTVTSSFGSPDYQSSQISFDTPRVGTAASSITDYPTMPSPRFGEPGPEMRISSDDVPSLTSSRSTMTSHMQNAFPLVAPRRPGDRSASLCSAPSEVESRRRKRSSIASLSRLINGSYGSEKSKLSIEQRPQSAYLAPTVKDPKKKTRRLSKLKFWKSSKDTASSSQA